MLPRPSEKREWMWKAPFLYEGGERTGIPFGVKRQNGGDPDDQVHHRENRDEFEGFFHGRRIAFILRTASSMPRNAALAMIEWPMFSSSISGMAAMGKMF